MQNEATQIKGKIFLHDLFPNEDVFKCDPNTQVSYGGTSTSYTFDDIAQAEAVRVLREDPMRPDLDAILQRLQEETRAREQAARE